MRTKYPELVKSESKRLLLTWIAIIFPVLGCTLIPSYFLGNGLITIGGLFLGILFSISLTKTIYNLDLVCCPICKSSSLNVDYGNSPRGTSKNVEYKCNSCKSIFLDDTLIESGT